MLAKASLLTRPVRGRPIIPPNICKNFLASFLQPYHLLLVVPLATLNSNGPAVVVYIPLLILVRPHPVDPSVEKHLNPGNDLSEDQPDIDHLHVSRLWEAA